MPRARHVLLPLIALLSLLTVPAAATAQSTTAPPGNSAIDEYLETVPGVSGNVRPKPPGEGGPATLTPAQRAALDDRGEDGRTLARVVEATAPPPRAATPAAAPERASRTPAAAAGRSPVTAALAATTGTDDRSALGLVLPAILLASLAGVVALVVTRRRRQT